MKKYLRSILCLLLALCMVMCFAACDKDEEEDEEEDSSIAGTYIIDSVEVGGEEVAAEDLADLGITEDSFYIILNKDGTGFACLDGDKTEIEWDDETLTADGESIEYTVKGNKLTIEMDGDKMTFKKTNKKIDPEAEPAEPEVTSTTYGIYAMIIEGQAVTGADLATLGMTANDTFITLNDDNTGVLSMLGETEDMNWNGSKMWAPNDPTDVVDMELDGDVLTITYDGVPIIFLKNGSTQVPELPQSSSIAGAYELYSMTEGSTVYDYETIKTIVLPQLNMTSMDELMSLTLNEDGTGKMTAMGVEAEMEYDDTKLWPKGMSSDSIEFTFDGTYLSFELEGYTYTFVQK